MPNKNYRDKIYIINLVNRDYIFKKKKLKVGLRISNFDIHILAAAFNKSRNRKREKDVWVVDIARSYFVHIALSITA